MNKRKLVQWSYPSSPNADKFGFGLTGCYTVQVEDGNNTPVAVSGHSVMAEAVQAAEEMPYPWRWDAIIPRSK